VYCLYGCSIVVGDGRVKLEDAVSMRTSQNREAVLQCSNNRGQGGLSRESPFLPNRETRDFWATRRRDGAEG
jgi:hypothetical protein